MGGGVRDLLLERRPKDFDIGTSAHPQQIKALFRNCWIIGRRFRLAHVRFGDKTIEVATFRKQLPPETDTERKAREEARERARREAEARGVRPRRLIRGDNTFGTAEEDAFRRDFTVNGLFYDAASRSILDYVDGMRDIRSRTLRSIGDPNERFVEDPVRMMRAVVLAARLDLSLDPAVAAAIRRHRGEIVHASPARLLEELYKVARSGAAERIVRDLGSAGLLKHIAPELHKARSDALWRSLAALDRYRRGYDDAPPALRNALLLGSLVAPFAAVEPPRRRGARDGRERRPPEVALGALPIARRDLEQLRQILDLQRRLADERLSPRARRALMHRSAFEPALTWMTIHGGHAGARRTLAQRDRDGGDVPRRRPSAPPPQTPPPTATARRHPGTGGRRPRGVTHALPAVPGDRGRRASGALGLRDHHLPRTEHNGVETSSALGPSAAERPWAAERSLER